MSNQAPPFGTADIATLVTSKFQGKLAAGGSHSNALPFILRCRLKILNKTLAVEFARPPSAGSASNPPPPKSSPGSLSGGTGGPLPPQPNAPMGPSRPESIAPGLKLDYPFPPHLRYEKPGHNFLARQNSGAQPDQEGRVWENNFVV